MSANNDGIMECFRLLCPAQVAAEPDSSCLYAALRATAPLFSPSGLRDIAGDCPFVFSSHHPDACGVNGRVFLQIAEDLKDVLNVFLYGGRCGAHQVHRIVVTVEALSCGDVHGCAVTQGHPRHADVMQQALLKLLDEVQIFPGLPPPEFALRNADVLKHTLFRKQEFIDNDVDVDGSFVDTLEDSNHPCNKFLRVWNGDYSQPIAQYYYGSVEAPPSRESVRDMLFAAAIDVDLLCSSEKSPSLDDWGSCSSACGKVAAGFLIHEVGPRCFRLALPSWASMKPENVAQATEGAEEERVKIQKKSWRTKCVYEEWPRMRKILQLAWTTHPLERLLSSLQVLDSTPRAALDLAFEDQQNPFYACRLKLANLMHVGIGGPFACLFAILPVQLHGVMADELSAQLSAFIAQVRWRFLEYETFPFQWNRVLHRAVNQDEIDDTFETFFDIMHSCCRREGIDDKMFKYFGGEQDPAGAKARMRADVEFWNAFRSWMHSYRWTDMNMERLFSKMRHWLKWDHAPVERMLALSLLGQMLGAHDGADPRYVTRQQLLADDVPIACAAKRAKTASKPASGFFIWMQQQKAMSGRSLPKQEYYEWQRARAKDWKESVSVATKELFQQKASQAHLNRKNQRGDEGAAAVASSSPPETFVKTFVNAVGDGTTPYAVSSFEARVRAELGLAGDVAFPGFYHYKDQLRESLLQQCLVKGLDAIPKQKKNIRHQQCFVEHPGICATRHHRFMPQLIAANKSLIEILKDQKRDTYWRLHARGRTTQGDRMDSYDETTWFHYAWYRGANPKMVVLGRAALDPDTRIVVLCDLEDAFDHLPAKSILGQVFRAGGDAAIRIDYIHLSPAPLPASHARRRWDRVELVEDFDEQMRNAEKHFFPPRILLAESLTTRAWVDAKLVSAMDGLHKAKVQRQPGRPRGFCIRPPRGEADGDDVDDEDDEGDDEESQVEQASNDDDDVGVEALVADIIRETAAREASAAGMDRARRATSFGCWTISTVWDNARGICIGYGGNCNAHYGSHLQCKRSFPKTSTFSLDESRRQAKACLFLVHCLLLGKK